MSEQWGVAHTWLSNIEPVWVVWGFVAFGVLASGYACWRERRILVQQLRSVGAIPWVLSGKYLTWQARRELRMKRARLLAMKERAANVLTEWLLYEVRTGNMTIQESYDLQMILARNMACPSLQPKYDATFVKSQIKARRAQGHRPVRLPDLDKRGKLRVILNGDGK